MNSLYSNERNHEQDSQGSSDREISLSTSSVLGIFFALALVCAIFFGLGYTLGRRAPAAVSAGVAGVPVNTSTNTTKPSPNGTVAPSAHSGDSSRGAAQDGEEAANEAAAAPVTRKAIASVARTLPPAPAPAAAPAPGTPGAGSFLVQVAAVSHKQDADLLVGALKQRGYSVNVRQEPQDKLLHVQVGPFPTHKDADEMRQRLIASGYNAIVK